MSSLKDMVPQDGVKCTHFQVADALTKAMDPDLLIEVLGTGKVTLQGEVPKKPPPPWAAPKTASVVQFRKSRKAFKKEIKQLKLWK